MPVTEYRGTCPLDCPSACALLVRVDAKERLESIRGNPDHPFTRGVICGKVNRYREIQEGPRIEHPLVRTGSKGQGQFRKASWDEALDIVAQNLRQAMEQHGPESILPYYYGGTMGIVQRPAWDRLTHRLGWSRLEKNICSGIGQAGWQAGVGKGIGPDPKEMLESDLIILWGINAVSTNINLMTFVKEARRRGATLLVVDPYRNRTARLADHHVAPRPGTDAALAVAMMHVLLEEGFEDKSYLAAFTDFDAELRAHLGERTPEWAAAITGLTAAEIRAFARRYGQARAPFIRIGYGMTRHNNGAVNVHAVSCLPAITGAWARPGGGILFSTGDALRINDEPVRQTAWMDPSAVTRLLDMSRLGAILTDTSLAPPVSALIVANANPAASCPDLRRVHAGLAREELFTVVHEQVMSDTALWADVVLPATTFLEHADLYKSYGQNTLQYARPVLPPRAQARCNHDLVNAIAKRLGCDDEPFTWSVSETIERTLAASGVPATDAWNGKSWLDFTPDPDAAHFRKGFAQPDGRFHFRPGWQNTRMPPLPDHWPVNQRDQLHHAERYPLDFMTPPAHDVLNSTFTAAEEARRRRGPPRLWIHPDDAQARGIEDGAPVSVFNDLGGLTMTAKITSDVRPGLCLCESNYHGAEFPEGVSLNALTHGDRVAPAGGAAFHDNRVEVKALDRRGRERTFPVL
ncbi:MAG: molybdopterin oxidoreductase family protein [Magnetococcales bacterium]|nr:molybdopterin oxidoreductase family protein [Magnetococcales bacterium]